MSGETTITRNDEGVEMVRYHSVYERRWREQRASAVPDKELAAMSSTERAEVMAAAERDKRLLDGRGPEVGRPSRGLDTLVSFRVPGELAERMRERAEADGKKVGETWRAAAERYLR